MLSRGSFITTRQTRDRLWYQCKVAIWTLNPTVHPSKLFFATHDLCEGVGVRKQAIWWLMVHKQAKRCFRICGSDFTSSIWGNFLTTLLAFLPPFRMDLFWFFHTLLSLYDDWQIERLLRTGFLRVEGGAEDGDWLPLTPTPFSLTV